MQHFLITGANRGLGLELVRQLLERPDVHIFATCREPEKATDLQQFSQPDRLTLIALDVTNPAEIEASVKVVRQHTNSLDVLINNAGIRAKDGDSLSIITPEAMFNVLQTNAIAPLMIVKAYLDLLKKGQNPRIVNISSQMGSMDYTRSGGSYAYSTSKAALNMITRQLAGDLGRDGITTITVHPGWVQTDMGGRSATLPAETAGQGVLQVIDNLSPRDNGRFFKWNGEQHAW